MDEQESILAAAKEYYDKNPNCHADGRPYETRGEWERCIEYEKCADCGNWTITTGTQRHQSWLGLYVIRCFGCQLRKEIEG